MQADIYIETDSMSQKAGERHYGYILECEYHGSTETRDGYGKINGTYHQAVLRALCDALRRFRRPCDITIHAEDEFVLNMIVKNLATWARSNFNSAGGKPIKNQTEWRVLWEAMQGHLISVIIGEHAYSVWLRLELKKRRKTDHGRKKNI